MPYTCIFIVHRIFKKFNKSVSLKFSWFIMTWCWWIILKAKCSAKTFIERVKNMLGGSWLFIALINIQVTSATETSFRVKKNFLHWSFYSSISIWSLMKKKPLVTVKNAHHGQDQNGNSSTQTNWITCVAALHNTDLVASGSSQ